jgi:hypothetical protein
MFDWLGAAFANPRTLPSAIEDASTNSVLVVLLVIGLGVHLAAMPFDPPDGGERWSAFLLKSAAVALPFGVARWVLHALTFRLRLAFCGVDSAPASAVFGATLVLNLVTAGALVAAGALTVLVYERPHDGVMALRTFMTSMTPLFVLRAWMSHHFACETFGATGPRSLFWFLVAPSAFWGALTMASLFA